MAETRRFISLEEAQAPFFDDIPTDKSQITDTFLNKTGNVIVAHKPELLRLTDMNSTGKAERSEVISTGWGISRAGRRI